jgi:hypothetical protein
MEVWCPLCREPDVDVWHIAGGGVTVCRCRRCRTMFTIDHYTKDGASAEQHFDLTSKKQ